MQKLNQLVNTKTLCILSGILLVAFLVPLLLLGGYAYPSLDDFDYGAPTYAAWNSTHSIGAVLHEGAALAGQRYMDWQGTLAACFLMTLQPGIFGEQYYAVVPVFLLAVLVAATLFFCQTFFSRLAGAKKSASFAAGFILLIFSLWMFPSPAQGIYWYNGGIYYTLFYSLMLVMLACVIRYYRAATTRRGVLMLCLAGLLGGMIGLSNYVTALTSLLLLLLAALLGKWNRQKWPPVLVPLAVTLICFAVSALAPGNNVRGELYSGASITGAIYTALVQAGGHLFKWVNLPFLLMLLVLAPVFYSVAGGMKYAFRKPLLVVLAFLFVFAAQFAPTAYALQGILAARVLNIIFLYFLLGACLCLFYCMGWLRKVVDRLVASHQAAGLLGAVRQGLLRYKVYYAVAAAALALFCIWPEVSSFSLPSVTAAKFLLLEQPQLYRQEMEGRLAVLKNGDTAVAELEPLYHQPDILKTEDILPDPGSWVNRQVAKYYGKQAVALAEGSE